MVTSFLPGRAESAYADALARGQQAASAGLAIDGLRRRFGGRAVLDGIGLRHAGGLLAVLGASGSGKTTLLRLIAGFDRPDAGTIRLGERLLSGPTAFLPPEQRRIGYVPQDAGLFPHLSVARNILFGLPRGARRDGAQVSAALRQVSLPAEIADRAIGRLSGGERQRVALARALMAAPRLLLLDEPFSALDMALRLALRETVSRLLAAQDLPAILVTHDRTEALSLARQVAVLVKGRIAQLGTPEAVYDTPVSLAVARLTGEVLTLPGIGRGDMAETALGLLCLRSTWQGPCLLLLRPEQIAAQAGEPGNATLLGHTFEGRDRLLRWRLDGTADGTPIGLTSLLPARDTPPAPGQRGSITVLGPVAAIA